MRRGGRAKRSAADRPRRIGQNCSINGKRDKHWTARASKNNVLAGAGPKKRQAQEKNYPSRGSNRDGLGGIGEWKDNGRIWRIGRTLDELFPSADQGPEPFGQQGDIERLFEGFVDRGTIEA